MRPGWENRPNPARKPCKIEAAVAAGPSAEVIALSQRLRHLYVENRSVIESLRAGTECVYRVPGRYDGLPPCGVEEAGTPSVWLTMANWVIANEVDPELFICDALEDRGRNHIPEPPQLMTEAMLKNYRTVEERLDLAGALNFQVEECRKQIMIAQTLRGLKKRMAYAWVLTNEDFELSSLFRYCLAKSLIESDGIGFARIATQYEKSAVVQYQRHRQLYAKHWSSFLPDGFAALAARVYQKLLSGGSNHD